MVVLLQKKTLQKIAENIETCVGSFLMFFKMEKDLFDSVSFEKTTIPLP